MHGSSTQAPALEAVARTGPGQGGRFPHLATDPEGRIQALWTEVLPRREEAEGRASGQRVHRLRTAALAGDAFTEPVTVAEGAGWFVNWADVPRVALAPQGRLAATWLEKLGAGSYAYGIRFALSTDGGTSFGAPSWLHTDRSETEHGFASLVPLTGGRFAAVWLDGRAMAGADPAGHGDDGHGGQGDMALYAGVIEGDGSVSGEVALDGRVCECCPTAMVELGDGTLVVAYRDRAADEVRDISVVRWRADEAASWSASRTVHSDGWLIPGCPVNGPALAARGKELVCAWFTMGGDDQPRVLAARSGDGGANFAAPVRIDGGNPIGRAGLAPLGAASWVVVWLEQTGPETAEWRARALTAELEPGPPRTFAEVPAARPSGFPALAPLGQGVLVLWTDPEGLGAVELRAD